MAAHTRPAPHDLADFLATHPRYEAITHYKVGKHTFMRWMRDGGFDIREKDDRPVPPDFHVYGGRETIAKLKDRYGASSKTISRWRKESGIKASVSRFGRLAPPDDFAAIAPTIHRSAAAQRWKVGDETLLRWARETGTSFKVWTGWRGPKAAPMPDGRADDLAGRAQRHLQRLMPVVKASIIEPKASGYLVAGRRMDEAGMIALAETKGFDPNEWRRVA